MRWQSKTRPPGILLDGLKLLMRRSEFLSSGAQPDKLARLTSSLTISQGAIPIFLRDGRVLVLALAVPRARTETRGGGTVIFSLPILIFVG